jgi:hypothetical protein
VIEQPITFEQFHEAAGRAMAAWAKAEEALRDLFTRLVTCGVTGGGVLESHPDGSWILGSIFYASTNLRARIDLLDRIFRRLIAETELLTEWNSLKNKTPLLYARRNVLAHGHVWGNNSGASFMGYSIFDDSKRKTMTHAQVCAASESFERYADRISALAIAANHHLAARR